MIDEEKTLFVDGFNECICGFTDDGRLIYSKSKMIQVLTKDSRMSFEDALEHCEINMWCAYIAEHAPIYINDFDSDLEIINEYINA